jgi:hypothetical protein
LLLIGSLSWETAVVSFPCLVRTVSGLGEARYALGDRLVDRYLEFVAGRARPNTLRAGRAGTPAHRSCGSRVFHPERGLRP